MTDADKFALAVAQARWLQKSLPLLAVSYWMNTWQNGDSGQFTDRDLQQARAEREAQKGRD